jgi:hypothetical protein
MGSTSINKNNTSGPRQAGTSEKLSIVDRSNADSALKLVLDINAGAGHAVSGSMTNLLSSSQRMAVWFDIML